MTRERSQHAPGDCPECGEAAYIGMSQVDCTNFRCRHFHEDTWQSHVLSLPDPGDPLDIDEDADTQPKAKLFDQRFFDYWNDFSKTQTLDIRAEIQKETAAMMNAKTGAALRHHAERIRQLNMALTYTGRLTSKD